MNTPRCKPGDLAVICHDYPGCEDNIGRIVTVRGPAAIDDCGFLTWLITPVTPEPYLIEIPHSPGVGLMEIGETDIEHPDAWMIPIAQPEHEEVENYEESLVH